MTEAEIRDVVAAFAAGAARAREAGLDGVELHACNGYLITQFLSSVINDRDDAYGGSLENRARFCWRSSPRSVPKWVPTSTCKPRWPAPITTT